MWTFLKSGMYIGWAGQLSTNDTAFSDFSCICSSELRIYEMKIWTSHPSLLLVYVFPEQILHFLNLRNLPITKSLIFSVSSAFLPKSTRPLLNSPPLHFVSQWMFYKALIDYFEQQCEFDNIEDIVTNMYVSWQFTEVRWFSDALHLRCSLLQIPQKRVCIRFHTDF